MVPGLAGDPFSGPRPSWGVVLVVPDLAGDPCFWSPAWLGSSFSALLEPLGGPLAQSWASFEPSEAVLALL